MYWFHSSHEYFASPEIGTFLNPGRPWYTRPEIGKSNMPKTGFFLDFHFILLFLFFSFENLGSGIGERTGAPLMTRGEAWSPGGFLGAKR